MHNNRPKNVPAAGGTPKSRARYSQQDQVEGPAQIQDKMPGLQFLSDREIEFNSHLLKKNTDAANARLQPNMRRQSPAKKGQAGPKSLQLTEQNRKMIKQMKDRQNKKEFAKGKNPQAVSSEMMVSEKSL